jgi:hypothetical protein
MLAAFINQLRPTTIDSVSPAAVYYWYRSWSDEKYALRPLTNPGAIAFYFISNEEQ